MRHIGFTRLRFRWTHIVIAGQTIRGPTVVIIHEASLTGSDDSKTFLNYNFLGPRRRHSIDSLFVLVFCPHPSSIFCNAMLLSNGESSFDDNIEDPILTVYDTNALQR